MDFIDTALTSSSHLSKVTCCLPDKTSTVATCGQGASCAGQCSALEGSFCPSGNCTEDPRTCDISFNINATNNQTQDNDQQSDVTVSGSDLNWCTGTTPKCKVRKNPECCLNPNCLTTEWRREACEHIDYFTGNYVFNQS